MFNFGSDFIDVCSSNDTRSRDFQRYEYINCKQTAAYSRFFHVSPEIMKILPVRVRNFYFISRAVSTPGGELPAKYSARIVDTRPFVSLFDDINVSVCIGTKLKLSVTEEKFPGSRGNHANSALRRYRGPLFASSKWCFTRDRREDCHSRERTGRQISI